MDVKFAIVKLLVERFNVVHYMRHWIVLHCRRSFNCSQSGDLLFMDPELN